MVRDDEQRDFARELRTHAESAERHLWQFLRAEQLGEKFRRQAAIGDYIVDFICFPRKLIVELAFLAGHSPRSISIPPRARTTCAARPGSPRKAFAFCVSAITSSTKTFTRSSSALRKRLPSAKFNRGLKPPSLTLPTPGGGNQKFYSSAVSAPRPAALFPVLLPPPVPIRVH